MLLVNDMEKVHEELGPPDPEKPQKPLWRTEGTSPCHGLLLLLNFSIISLYISTTGIIVHPEHRRPKLMIVSRMLSFIDFVWEIHLGSKNTKI